MSPLILLGTNVPAVIWSTFINLCLQAVNQWPVVWPSTMHFALASKQASGVLTSFFFYDVILHCRRLHAWNSLSFAYFVAVLGTFYPQNVTGHCSDLKRHIRASLRVFWAILRQKSNHGYCSRRVGSKIKTKINFMLHFTYLARRSLTADMHEFGTCSRGGNQLCKVAKC